MSKKTRPMKQGNDMKWWHIPIGIVVGMVAVGLLMCSCKTIEYVPVIQHETHHDSIYFTQIQRDSIWQHDSILIKDRGDTVWVEKWHTKYVEKQVHDTTYIAKIDSIPAPYPVKEYVEKPLNWWQKSLIWTGIVALMVVILICARWLSKRI